MSDLISVPTSDFAPDAVSASGPAFGCAADTPSDCVDAATARPAVWAMEAIAHVRSDFPGKFGVPRQSGLVEALEARVVFTPPWRNRDALRGLEGFSHIWLVWVFDRAVRDTRAVRGGGGSQQGSGQQSSIQHGNGQQGNGQQGSIQQGSGQQGSAAAPARRWSPTVRPPRLGGNARLGVFATRSPFRPNPIGLSCVRLDGIDDTAEGPVLRIRGADLADGTPVLDIKPYVPYADSRPEAAGGFASTAPEAALEVEIPPSLLERVPAGRREALYGVLAQDPRPRYIDDPARVYGFGFAGLEVRFTVEGGRLTVREIL